MVAVHRFEISLGQRAGVRPVLGDLVLFVALGAHIVGDGFASLRLRLAAAAAVAVGGIELIGVHLDPRVARVHLRAVSLVRLLAGDRVLLELFGPTPHPHIEAAQQAELLCVAPATANILAKAAWGLADDLLSTVLLAFSGPVVMAPAMNDRMWEKPSVQRNVAQLRQDGVHLVDPEEGYLSCGARGPGRMASPETIFDVITTLLKSTG